MISDKLKLILIHIPKTGGSSVVSHLRNFWRGIVTIQDDWDKAFQNVQNIYNDRSMKHCDVSFFKKYYPLEYSCYRKVALVREPEERLISLFMWTKGYNKVFNDTEFLEWIKRNSPKPICDFVDENTELFTIEEIKSNILDVEWETLPEINVNKYTGVELSENTSAFIKEKYKKDFVLYSQRCIKSEQAKTCPL